ELIALDGIGEVEPGNDLAGLIAGALDASGLTLADADCVVVTQKVVSKAEGMVRRLSEVEPSPRAIELGNRLGKEAELIELVLSESREILRDERVLITETHHGFVCANAGIDASNLPEDGTVCLLPRDPDASARGIRKELMEAGRDRWWGSADNSGEGPATPTTGPSIAGVVADSFGRAWRLGQAEVAIGCAGLVTADDWRGREDASGRELSATVIAVADEVAAAADLVRAKNSGVPAAVVRGLAHYVLAEDGPGASALRRPRSEDLFR
ncbi:MAG TPA: coenzyme F420-0:L-glutamate ligase, partial [Solirubrobacterales bacterium]|nr:coenzyme F420-0:L-glutamate ligase [Solirubrobacterales bacterium]